MTLMVPGHGALDGFTEIPGGIPTEQRAGFFNRKREQGGLVGAVWIRAVHPLARPYFQDLFYEAANRLASRWLGTEIERADEARVFGLLAQTRGKPEIAAETFEDMLPGAN